MNYEVCQVGLDAIGTKLARKRTKQCSERNGLAKWAILFSQKDKIWDLKAILSLQACKQYQVYSNEVFLKFQTSADCSASIYSTTIWWADWLLRCVVRSWVCSSYAIVWRCPTGKGLLTVDCHGEVNRISAWHTLQCIMADNFNPTHGLEPIYVRDNDFSTNCST